MISMSSTILLVTESKGLVKLLNYYSSFLPRESNNCANNAVCPGQSEVILKMSQFNKWKNGGQKRYIHGLSNILYRKAIM